MTAAVPFAEAESNDAGFRSRQDGEGSHEGMCDEEAGSATIEAPKSGAAADNANGITTYAEVSSNGGRQCRPEGLCVQSSSQLVLCH